MTFDNLTATMVNETKHSLFCSGRLYLENSGPWSLNPLTGKSCLSLIAIKLSIFTLFPRKKILPNCQCVIRFTGCA